MKRLKGLFRRRTPAQQATQSWRAVPEQNRPSSPGPIPQAPTLVLPNASAPSISSATPSPAQEPDQSAADQPSAPNKESQSRFKEVKDTTLNTLKLSLSLLTTISGSIPVPGLKAAFAGLEMVLGWFDVSSLHPCR